MDYWTISSTNVNIFSVLALDQRFSLPLFDFILSIDKSLPLNLPNRLDHLVKL